MDLVSLIFETRDDRHKTPLSSCVGLEQKSSEEEEEKKKKKEEKALQP
tara:strand:- start:343 stop:486 length:144 start_codon:yes stop_codon:yes gene_type:complete